VTKQQPNISIVIISHNTRALTLRCLESLIHIQNSERIVVDTGSTDGTIEAFTDPRITVVTALASTGYAAAAHLGVKQAVGANLIICNADTEFLPGAVECLVKALSDSATGIAAPRLLNTDATLQHSWARFPNIASEWSGCLDRSEVDNPECGSHKVSWVGGACIALKSTTWDALNGYNPDIMFYGEDTDLCWRAQQAGLNTVFLADAVVTHHGGSSSSARSPLWLRKHLLRARLRDLRTANGPLAAIPAQCITLARFVAWLLKGIGTNGAHRP
jgi:N-acetylglucosaminyl-diphospho-decaprenol L-rhamnosyltransferase